MLQGEELQSEGWGSHATGGGGRGASAMSVCADTRREWTVLASHDANDGDISLGVRGRNQSESHDSLPKLTEYFEETLVTFAQKLDSRGGEQGVREKVVKQMVVSLLGMVAPQFMQDG